MDLMLADIILFNKSTAMQRGLYSTTIFLITVVKMLWTHSAAPRESVIRRFLSIIYETTTNMRQVTNFHDSLKTYLLPQFQTPPTEGKTVEAESRF